jgi:predicted AAA+ superfamily ATPase
MDIRFLPHNIHLENPDLFSTRDPHLQHLRKQLLIHRSKLLDLLPRQKPGIYTVSGGRQIGKTTLLKQWMNELLESGVAPERIVYITGELVDDHHSLVRLLTDILKERSDKDLSHILLDEVTYIKDWDKGIKYLADAGMLENIILLITGSDLAIIKEARMRFPGRRGAADTVDFHLYSLSFREAVELNKQITADEIEELMSPDAEPDPSLLNKLYDDFHSYLAHGGFLTAMNDMARHQHILPATFSTYSDWIRGDVLKRKKHEHYLYEILGAIVKRYGSQVTWNALARDLSIDHPQTVSDYAALLVSMDAVFIQSALLEDKLTAAPKKAKKLMFTSPFIFHAVRAWLNPREDPFAEQVMPALNSPDWNARLAETSVVTHYQRKFPTYYIKAEGEIDIAYICKNRFWPVEIKWTKQLRPKELKQISKYSNGLILTRSKQFGRIANTPTEPLPLAMLRLE